jgi:hypothetical protein
VETKHINTGSGLGIKNKKARLLIAAVLVVIAWIIVDICDLFILSIVRLPSL